MEIVKDIKRTYVGGKLSDVYYGEVRMPHYHGVKGSLHESDLEWSVGGVLPDGRVYEIVIKPGFVFDGASVPRFLWRVTGHPLEVPRVAAGFAHDWLYRSQVVSRKIADLIYRDICLQVGMTEVRADVEYASLRAVGWIAWNGKGEGEKAEARRQGVMWLEGEKL